MPNVFLPPLGSQWRLTAPWSFPTAILNSYNNWPFRANLRQIHGVDQPGVDYPEFQGLAEQPRPDLDLLDADTIIQFNRYHVSNSGEDEITLEIIRTPNIWLIPKNKGGKGKGKMRFYLPLAALNTFPEIEYVPTP